MTNEEKSTVVGLTHLLAWEIANNSEDVGHLIEVRDILVKAAPESCAPIIQGEFDTAILQKRGHIAA